MQNFYQRKRRRVRTHPSFDSKLDALADQDSLIHRKFNGVKQFVRDHADACRIVEGGYLRWVTSRRIASTDVQWVFMFQMVDSDDGVLFWNVAAAPVYESEDDSE